MKATRDDRGVIVQAGDTIGRRFRLVRGEEYDIPGATHFVARDLRLHQDVTVAIISSLAPSSVLRAARRAQVVRDRRLARILATGVERREGDRVTYVVSERPVGVRLDAFLGRVAFLPETAAAVVAEVAATLMVPALSGVRHGMIRPRCLTVTPRGRVVLSGLGVEGELRSQAGLGRGRSERVDAVALARIFVTAVTAMDADDVTSHDLPDDLTKPARDLCEALLRGSGPLTLSHITAALGAADASVLRVLAAEAPTLWWPRWPDLDKGANLADADTDAAAAAPADEVVEPRVGSEVTSADPIAAPAARADADGAPALPADGGAHAGPVDPSPTRLRTRFGGAVDDIDEFHDIVAAQNVDSAPSVVEAIFERLHQRFPRSAPLADFAEAAHRRAQTVAPFNVGPLLVALFVVALFVAGVIGASMITQPIDPPVDGLNHPSQVYPEFTVGQVHTPSPEG